MARMWKVGQKVCFNSDLQPNDEKTMLYVRMSELSEELAIALRLVGQLEEQRNEARAELEQARKALRDFEERERLRRQCDLAMGNGAHWLDESQRMFREGGDGDE